MMNALEPEEKQAPIEKFDFKLRASDVPEDVWGVIQEETQKALKKGCKNDKDIAATLKKTFDEKYPKSTWHAVVGSHFAVSVSHETKFFTFFDVKSDIDGSITCRTVLLFKSQD